MKGMLLSSTSYLSTRVLILTIGLLTAALGLIVGQTVVVSEVNGVKREVNCTLFDVSGGVETRYCCMYEIDEETGDKTLVECWWEQCDIGTDICDTFDPGGKSNIPDGPAIDEEVLPTPPASGGSTPGGITDRLPGEQEVLPTPPDTAPQDDTGITDRTVDEREVLPTTPSTPSPLGEASPLQGSPTLTEPEECNEGEILNEQTGQCESVEEPEPEEPEQPEPEEPEQQEQTDDSEDNGNN